MAFQVHCERPSTGQIWELATIGEIRVSKSKNEPSSLQATFLRDYMTVETGDIIAVQLNDEGMDDFNLFYGYVYQTSKSMDEVTVTAYDQLYQLKKSREFKVYGSKTASDLFIQIIEELKLFKLDPPNILNTEHVIPNIIADNVSPLDLMVDALNITFENTGKHYYMYDFFRNLCIGESELHKIPREEYELNEWNIKSYSYEENILEWINEVIVVSESDENNVLAVRRDETAIEHYGANTMVIKAGEGENAEAIAEGTFNSKRQRVQDLTVSVYGCNPQVYPARNIYFDMYSSRNEYISGWFTVESVDYTLKDGSGDMDLRLKLYDMDSELWTT